MAKTNERENLTFCTSQLHVLYLLPSIFKYNLISGDLKNMLFYGI
jgi:hypothetical protein